MRLSKELMRGLSKVINLSKEKKQSFRITLLLLAKQNKNPTCAKMPSRIKSSLILSISTAPSYVICIKTFWKKKEEKSNLASVAIITTSNHSSFLKKRERFTFAFIASCPFCLYPKKKKLQLNKQMDLNTIIELQLKKQLNTPF